MVSGRVTDRVERALRSYARTFASSAKSAKDSRQTNSAFPPPHSHTFLQTTRSAAVHALYPPRHSHCSATWILEEGSQFCRATTPVNRDAS